MNENEIKKLIGNLKYRVDVYEFKKNKAKSYIARLEDNLRKDFSEKSYENMKKRDKCLSEEIASFIEEIVL